MKNKTYGYIALIIGLVAFNVIVFAIPAEHTAAFWTVYAFTVIAFFAQIFTWNRAFKNVHTLKNKFLGEPIVYVSSLYLNAQIACFAAIVASNAPTWVSVVSSTAILGVAGLLIIAGEISRSAVQKTERKRDDNTAFLKNLRLTIDCMVAEEKNSEIQSKLQDIAEFAKYSDPVSSIFVSEVENEIEDSLALPHSIEKLDLVITLLKKRNNIIKTYKGKGDQQDGD